MIVHLNRASRIPLYEQIASQLRKLILTGAWREGHRLPASRELAEALSVNRKTVVDAYRILRCENLVTGRGRGGTVVRPILSSSDIPEIPRPVPWGRLATEMTHPSYLKGDWFYERMVRELPHQRLGYGPEAGLQLWGNRSIVSDIWSGLSEDIAREGIFWTSPRGYPPLKQLICRRLSSLGMHVPEDCIVITENSGETTFVVSSAFLQRGDSVALEVPCDPIILHVYNTLGVRIHPLPAGDQGANPAWLDGILRKVKPKLIHLSPSCRIPTGTIMGVERRQELLAIANQHRVPILEMSEYESLTYGGDIHPAICSLDSKFQTLYASSFEHELPLGLPISWVAAPKRVVQALGPIKQAMGAGLHPLVAALAVRALNHPEYRLEEIRKRARRERDYLMEQLDAHCGSFLRYDPPSGGLYLWATLVDGVPSPFSHPNMAAYWPICLPGYYFFPETHGGERNLCFSFYGYEPRYVMDATRAIGAILRERSVHTEGRIRVRGSEALSERAEDATADADHVTSVISFQSWI